MSKDWILVDKFSFSNITITLTPSTLPLPLTLLGLFFFFLPMILRKEKFLRTRKLPAEGEPRQNRQRNPLDFLKRPHSFKDAFKACLSL